MISEHKPAVIPVIPLELASRDFCTRLAVDPISKLRLLQNQNLYNRVLSCLLKDAQARPLDLSLTPSPAQRR